MPVPEVTLDQREERKTRMPENPILNFKLS